MNIKLNEEWACIRCEGVKISAFSIEVMYDTGFRCVECPISARIISHGVRYLDPSYFFVAFLFLGALNKQNEYGYAYPEQRLLRTHGAQQGTNITVGVGA